MIRRLLIRVASFTNPASRAQRGVATQPNAQPCVRMRARKTGIKARGTSYALRHSTAVHCLNATAPITLAQHLLGHVSLANKGIYTELPGSLIKQIA